MMKGPKSFSQALTYMLRVCWKMFTGTLILHPVSSARSCPFSMQRLQSILMVCVAPVLKDQYPT